MSISSCARRYSACAVAVALGAVALGAVALGAVALGAVALGAVALGAVALGAAAVGAVAVVVGAVAVGAVAVGAAAVGAAKLVAGRVNANASGRAERRKGRKAGYFMTVEGAEDLIGKNFWRVVNPFSHSQPTRTARLFHQEEPRAS